MQRTILAAGAAAFALLSAGARANDVVTPTFTASVGIDATSEWQNIAASGSGITFSWLPSVVAGSDVTIDWLSEFDVHFSAAPGFTVVGYDVALTVGAGIGAAYSGTIYGADTGPGSAYASVDTPFGGISVSGLGGYGQLVTQSYTGSGSGGDAIGYVRFMANAEAFCVVPLSQCVDVGADIGTIAASAEITSFTITPVSVSSVPEPTSVVLWSLGLLGLRASRRLSARGTA